jgi:hypothetical protein
MLFRGVPLLIGLTTNQGQYILPETIAEMMDLLKQPGKITLVKGKSQIGPTDARILKKKGESGMTQEAAIAGLATRSSEGLDSEVSYDIAELFSISHSEDVGAEKSMKDAVRRAFNSESKDPKFIPKFSRKDLEKNPAVLDAFKTVLAEGKVQFNQEKDRYELPPINVNKLKEKIQRVTFRYDDQMSNAASFERDGERIIVYLNSTLDTDEAMIQAALQKFIMHELLENHLVEALSNVGLWDVMQENMDNWQNDLNALSLKKEFEGAVDGMVYQMMSVQEVHDLILAYNDILDLELYREMEALVAREETLLPDSDLRIINEIEALQNILTIKKNPVPNLDNIESLAKAASLTAHAA